LAFRVALADPQPEDQLDIDPQGLAALPWTFLLGYILPLALMVWPLASARLKHSMAGIYQQWNLYISAVHYALVWYWGAGDPGPQRVAESIPALDKAYMVTIVMAAAGHWVPIVLCCLAKVRPKLFGARVSSHMTLRNVFVPPSPFKVQRSETMADGGKWLLQWDNLVGTMATVVWAWSLYSNINANSFDLSLIWKLLGYFVLAGPMGIPIGLLRERDYMALA